MGELLMRKAMLGDVNLKKNGIIASEARNERARSARLRNHARIHQPLQALSKNGATPPG